MVRPNPTRRETIRNPRHIGTYLPYLMNFNKHLAHTPLNTGVAFKCTASIVNKSVQRYVLFEILNHIKICNRSLWSSLLEHTMQEATNVCQPSNDSIAFHHLITSPKCSWSIKWVENQITLAKQDIIQLAQAHCSNNVKSYYCAKIADWVGRNLIQ